MSSVLDLPMERQLELAERRGLTHPEWVEKMKSSLDECDVFLEKIQKAEREAKSTRTPEEVANFQRRIDSGNPR